MVLAAGSSLFQEKCDWYKDSQEKSTRCRLFARYHCKLIFFRKTARVEKQLEYIE